MLLQRYNKYSEKQQTEPKFFCTYVLQKHVYFTTSTNTDQNEYFLSMLSGTLLN